MKKKLLFILLLLIPFIVKANNLLIPDDYYEFDRHIERFNNDNSIYIQNSNMIMSINKKTLEQNEILFPGNDYSDHVNYNYFYLTNSILIVFRDSNGDVYSNLYDEDLNLVKEQKLGNFKKDFIIDHGEEYLVVSGQSIENDEYYREIYFINKNGQLYKQDKVKTGIATIPYADSHSNDFYFTDGEHNYFIIDYKLKKDDHDVTGIRCGDWLYPISGSHSGNTYYYFEQYNDPRLARIRELKGEENIYWMYYTKDSENTIANIVYKKIENGQTYIKLETIYYDKNFNEIFNNEIYDWMPLKDSQNKSEYYAYNTLYDDFIVVVAANNDNSYFYIYDKEGNLIEDDSDLLPREMISIANLQPSPKGVILDIKTNWKYEPDTETGSAGYYQQSIITSYIHKFLINKNIKSGEGTLNVVESEVPGEPVKIVITPKEGYTLGTVKVIDANGNVLTFTNNTFTMPSSDVTIEVEFLVENAKTADIAITTIILLCILSIIVIFTQRKKIEIE